jgi:UDP:flavonoid glycosyltransferase YjiC (YdhE family)
MKILIASTAAPGHLNPLLSGGNILMKHNHEEVVQTATSLRPIVEAAGAPFVPFLSLLRNGHAVNYGDYTATCLDLILSMSDLAIWHSLTVEDQ